MTNTICLSGNSSTIKLLTKKEPVIENGSEDKNRKDEGWLRTKDYYKKPHKNKPLITVITVVFNADKYLEQTILSIINQNYKNIEFIIIDGASTDGTIDIINKYENIIDNWISEKDNGVYDAMNKGIKLAKGKWINFMNAGDSFYNHSTVSDVFKEDYSDIDIIYGDRQVIFSDNKSKFIKAKELESMWQGKPMCHQSCFVAADYHKKNLFTLNYDICDDFKFIYDAYHQKATFQYVDIVIAKYRSGGLSVDNIHRAVFQDWLIVDKSMKVHVYYIRRFIQVTVQETIKNILKYDSPHTQRNAIQNNISSIIQKIKNIH